MAVIEVGDVSVRVVRDDRDRVARVVLQGGAVVGMFDVGVGLRGDGIGASATAGRTRGHDVNVVGGDRLRGVARRPVHPEVPVAGREREILRRRGLRQRVAHVHRGTGEPAQRAILHAEDVGHRVCGAGVGDRRIVASDGPCIGEGHLVRTDRVGPGLRQCFRARELRGRGRRIGGATGRIARAQQQDRLSRGGRGAEVPVRDQL